MTAHGDLAPRILQRLRALGYWRNGRADVARFCADKGYRPQYVYAWLRGRAPSYDDLTRLAADLGTTIGWLMFGLPAAATGAAPPGAALEVLEADGPAGLRRRPAQARSDRPSRRPPPRPGGVEPAAQIIDFTRLLAVRASLELLEAEMETVLRAVPDQLVWLDAAGLVVGRSGGRAAAGAPPGPTGKRLGDLYPPDVASLLEDGLARAVATAEVVAVEYEVDAGSERRSYEARFVPLATGAAVEPRVLAIARDVTDLRRAERSARALLQVSHEIAGTLEPDEVVRRILARLVAMFGARVAALYRVVPESGDLVVEQAAGTTSPEQWIGQTIPQGTGMVGCVATEGRTLCTPDFLADFGADLPAWVHARASAEDYRAVASVPLRGQQGVIGVLTIGREAGHRFAPADIELLEGFADQAAVAFENARLHAETRALGERFRTLSELSALVSSSLDLDEALGAIAQAGARLLEAALVAFCVADPATGALAVRAVSDLRYADGDFLWRFEPDQGVAGWAARRRTAVAVPDALADPRVPNPAWWRRHGLRGLLVLPIVQGDTLLGVVTACAERPFPLVGREERLLRAFGGQAAVAIRNARLYAEARALGERFRTLGELSGVVSSSLDLDEVLLAIARAGARLMSAPLVSLTVADPPTGELRVRAVSDPRYTEGAFRWVLPLGTGIVPQAAERRVPVTIPDVFEDPRLCNESWWRLHGFRSCLALPIIAPDDTLLGVLSVCGPAPFRLDASEEALLQIFAAQAASAIRNARLYAESETRRHTAEALMGVGRVLSETLDSTAVAQTIARGVPASLGAKTAGLFRLDPRTGALVEVAHAGDVGPRTADPIVYPAGTGIMGLAVQARGPVASPNVLTDPRVRLTAEARTRIEGAAYRAALAVPLVLEDRVIGALGVGDREGRVFGEDDVRVLGALADQAAVAFEKARLFAEAERRRAEAEEIARVASQLTEAGDARAVAERIVTSVLQIFAAHSSVLRLLQADGSLVAAACGGRIAPHLPPGHVQAPGTGYYGRAVGSGAPVAIRDVQDDPRLDLPEDIRRAEERAGDRAFLVVPLRIRGRILGALSIGADAPRDFSPDEVRLLQLFADQAALAIDHARLRAAIDGR